MTRKMNCHSFQSTEEASAKLFLLYSQQKQGLFILIIQSIIFILLFYYRDMLKSSEITHFNFKNKLSTPIPSEILEVK